MRAPDNMPQAFFGGLLWGDNAVRYVFMDEAGTSAHEPVTVVVGLIVHADKQLMFAEAAIKEALGAVPPKFRDGFVFHATEVWGSPAYREDWGMADRLALLHRMMSLPRRLGVPISVSMVRRSAGAQELPNKLSLAEFHHVQAFGNCVAIADRYIRDHAELNEVGSIVAEDVPEMRRFLRAAANVWRDNPIVLPAHGIMPTQQEIEQGFMHQRGEMRVSRIRKAVHFVEKGDDPVTQLADACAFGFRRFFANQSFGPEFVHSMLGSNLDPRDFEGPSTIDTYRFHP